MEEFRSGGHRQESSEPEDRIEIDSGQWWWVKKDGRWRAELFPPTDFTPEGSADTDKRMADLSQMMQELRERHERTGIKNEGFLRDHPRYKELFIKWAIRRVRLSGFNYGRYSGDVSDRGYLLDTGGTETSEKITHLVRNAREWIDEYVGFELELSEGFVDITNDYERREETEEYPHNEGWYNEDQY
jgi:hypothetical protein